MCARIGKIYDNFMDINKKRICCPLFCLCCILLVHVHAEGNTYHTLSHQLRLDFFKGVKEGIFSDVITYGIFSPNLYASAGIKNTAGEVSTFVSGTYLPLKLKYFSLGIQSGYNMNFLTDYCAENNIRIGSILSAGKQSGIQAIIDCSYLLKLTDFYRLHNIVPLIIDHTLAVSLSVQANVASFFLLGVKLSSYDMFYYPLFFNPYYEMEGTLLINPHFKIKGLLGVRYSDMFTLTAYPACFTGGVCMEFKILP